MIRPFFLALFLTACAGSSAPATSATSAPASSSAPAANAGDAAACPATLDCQPPTNDKDELCRIPRDEAQRRCPGTKFLD